ncbi:hypothetical protein HYQ46_001380 [Verticillium longisporum]|nr:hypothetical protein HYQ46_001380 [Verticillium longisporum]
MRLACPYVHTVGFARCFAEPSAVTGTALVLVADGEGTVAIILEMNGMVRRKRHLRAVTSHLIFCLTPTTEPEHVASLGMDEASLSDRRCWRTIPLRPVVGPNVGESSEVWEAQILEAQDDPDRTGAAEYLEMM